MIVIAILAIPFVFYFVKTPDYGAIRADQFARIYDRNVSTLEAQQSARLLNLAQALGMSDFVGTMTAGAGINQNQAAVQFIVNLLVLRHEADRLGCAPALPRLPMSYASCRLSRATRASTSTSSMMLCRTGWRRWVFLKSTSNNWCATRFL